MITALRSMFRDDNGATMVEYGIMIALIAAVCIVLISTLGQKVNSQFASINSGI